MLSIWPALFDLSWILTAQALAAHNLEIVAVPAAIYLTVRLGRFETPQRVMVVLLLAAGAVWGGFWGVVLGLAAFVLAYLRRHTPSHRRYAYMAGVIAWAILTISHPASTLSPFVLIAWAVGGLVMEAWRHDADVTLVMITGLAGLGSLFIALILWVVPWGFLTAHVLGLAGGAFVSLILMLMPKLKLRSRNHISSPAQGLHILREHAKPHDFVGADVLIVVVGLAVFVLVLWMIFRKNRFDALEQSKQSEAVGVQLETVTIPLRSVWNRMVLPPVRTLVKNQLRKAQKQGHGKLPGQTFRQWVINDFGSSPRAKDIARIYEEVRYGGGEDNREQAHRLGRLWRSPGNRP